MKLYLNTRLIVVLFGMLGSISLAACVQPTEQSKPSSEQASSAQTNIQKATSMSTPTFSNPTVKAAFDAWQAGDSKAWLALFSADAQLFDDGKPRNFQKFSTQTIGKEKFTSVDKIENQGTEIYGNFHSPQWGDFKTYFKFHIDATGKIHRLDIGQAN